METFIPVIFIVAIAEMIISGTWQPFYFTMGIPLYKKSAVVSYPPILSIDELNGYFKKGMSSPILFKEISDNQIAFREALFSFSLLTYTPVMHGLIRYDQGIVQVVGMANWFAPVFIFFFIAVSAGLAGPLGVDLFFIIFPIGLFALLYFIQFKRYNKVFYILTESSSDKI